MTVDTRALAKRLFIPSKGSSDIRKIMQEIELGVNNNVVGMPQLAIGATNSRYVGGTSGNPATFMPNANSNIRDVAVDAAGIIWVCTASGTPGTWKAAGGVNNQYTARAVATASQSAPVNTTTVMTYGVADYDNSISFTLATGTYTAAIAGIYHVDGHTTFSFASWVVGNQIILDLFKNGTIHSRGSQIYPPGNGSANTPGVHYSGNVKCAAGDTLTLRFFQSGATGSPVTYSDGNNAWCYMSVDLVAM